LKNLISYGGELAIIMAGIFDGFTFKGTYIFKCEIQNKFPLKITLLLAIQHTFFKCGNHIASQQVSYNKIGEVQLQSDLASD